MIRCAAERVKRRRAHSADRKRRRPVFASRAFTRSSSDRQRGEERLTARPPLLSGCPAGLPRTAGTSWHRARGRPQSNETNARILLAMSTQAIAAAMQRVEAILERRPDVA